MAYSIVIPLFPGKRDLYEIICKFKMHDISREEIEKIKENGNTEIDVMCQRCHHTVRARMDPDNSSCYLVSDID